MKERRNFPRSPIRLEVICENLANELQEGKVIVSFYSSDISLGGIFLETDVPFSIGDILQLKFEIPSIQGLIPVTGKVVRIDEGAPSSAPGVGVKFEYFGHGEKKIIERYVAKKIADQL